MDIRLEHRIDAEAYINSMERHLKGGNNMEAERVLVAGVEEARRIFSQWCSILNVFHDEVLDGYANLGNLEKAAEGERAAELGVMTVNVLVAEMREAGVSTASRREETILASLERCYAMIEHDFAVSKMLYRENYGAAMSDPQNALNRARDR